MRRFEILNLRLMTSTSDLALGSRTWLTRLFHENEKNSTWARSWTCWICHLKEQFNACVTPHSCYSGLFFFLPPVVSPFIKVGKREFSNWPWHCIEPWLMPRHWTTLCAYYWDARDLWKWKTGPCVVEAVVFMWDRWRRVCQTIRCENINHAFWEKSVSLPVLRVYQIDRWKWRRSVRLIKLVSVMFY